MNDITITQHLTVEQIIHNLNQQEGVPTEAIHAALESPRETIIPALLAVLKNVVDNCQKIPHDHVGHITTMYLLAKFREPQACPYILAITGLYRDLPENLLGDVNIEGITSLIVSTYDGNLQAIKNIVENTHANLYSRIGVLQAMIGLFAIDKLPRDEVVAYYKYLINSPILTKDTEFISFVACEICHFFARELYDDCMALFDANLVDKFFVSKENFQEALLEEKEDIKENITKYRFYAPVDDVISQIYWLYRSTKDEEEIMPAVSEKKETPSRNSPCPCDSGKKYKKCCLNFKQVPF